MLFDEFQIHCKAGDMDAREVSAVVWVITHDGNDIVTVWAESRCYEITGGGHGSITGGPHRAIHHARVVVDQQADEPAKIVENGGILDMSERVEKLVEAARELTLHELGAIAALAARYQAGSSATRARHVIAVIEALKEFEEPSKEASEC